MWVYIYFLTTFDKVINLFYVRCWLEVPRKIEGKTQSLGITFFPPKVET